MFDAKTLTEIVKTLKKTKGETIFIDQVEAVSDLMCLMNSRTKEGDRLAGAVADYQGENKRLIDLYTKDSDSTDCIIISVFNLLNSLLLKRAEWEAIEKRAFRAKRVAIRKRPVKTIEAVDVANKILEAHGTALKLYSE